MADKLKLSSEATEILSKLSSRLDLKRHTICRIAMSISLSLTQDKPDTDPDYSGQEFNKSTIMGSDEYAFLAMIANNANEVIDISESFNTIVRDHIINGLKIMNKKYETINSPIDFMKELIAMKKE